MWAYVQCVDMLKQIAGDDRDTEHEFLLPTHYSGYRKDAYAVQPHLKACHFYINLKKAMLKSKNKTCLCF